MTINNGYLELTVVSDRDTMIQTALANIATSLPGWQPHEGNLEVLLLEQFAEMSSEAALVAAQVPLSIFSYYGSLIGLTQNSGTTMSIVTTWSISVASATDTVFPAGTSAGVLIDNVLYSFVSASSVTILAGSTSVTNVVMNAASSGASYNAVQINGVQYLTPTYLIANLSAIQINSFTTQGTDAESTSTYLDRLSNALSVYTPRPITPNDYASLLPQVANVHRATALNNVNPFLNLFGVTDAIPSTPDWSIVTGASSLANNTTYNGLQVNVASSFQSFNGAASAITAGATFLPFLTTTTNAAVTSTTIPLTSVGGWVSANGYGYIVADNDGPIGFSYTGITSTTLTGVVFSDTTKTFSATSGILVAYAGTSTWWADAGTTRTKPTPDGTNAGQGIALSIKQIASGGTSEAVVVKGVTSQSTSGVITKIGFSTSPVNASYSAGVIFTTCPGVTTGAQTVSSNCVNMIGTAAIVTGTASTAIPVLVATVTYQNMSGNYVYYSDPTASGDYTLNQLLSVFIPGTAPTALTSVTLADPTLTNYKPNVATVSLNVFWTGAATSSTKYITYSSLYLTNENFAYFKDKSWNTILGSVTNGYASSDPGNILPDAAFNSVYYYVPPSSTFNGGSAVSLSSLQSSGNFTLTSTSGWPTSGAGTFVDDSNAVHYFTYTGVNTSSQLTGFACSNSGSGTITNKAVVTSLSPNNLPALWKYTTNATSGNFNALPGSGIQFTTTSATAATTGSASAASEVFTLIANTKYIIDYTIDLTNTNASNTSATMPDVTIHTTSGSSLYDLKPAVTQIGSKARVTGTYTPTVNTDVYLIVYFPVGFVPTGNAITTITNLSMTPAIGSLSAVTTSYASALDNIGLLGTGPSWSPGGVNGNNFNRNVTAIVANENGLDPDISIIQNSQTYLSNYREVNFNVNVVGPSYLLIDVSYSVSSARGYDIGTVSNSILSNLLRLISPSTWASSNTNLENWDPSQNTINYLDVVGLIDDADGVANITSVSIGIHGGSLGTSSINLTSALATLPILATVSGNIIPSNSTVFEISGR